MSDDITPPPGIGAPGMVVEDNMTAAGITVQPGISAPSAPALTVTAQTQLNALRNAYASGVTSCQYDGKSVSYRSLDEMRAAIAALENQLNGGKGVGKSIFIRSVRGW
jgi:hypothetical protein